MGSLISLATFSIMIVQDPYAADRCCDDAAADAAKSIPD
jgi:hypothetical protein